MNAKVGELMLSNWRLAFSQGLWEAQTVQGRGRPAFSCTLIAPPDHPDIAKVKAALLQVAQAKWGQNGQQMLQALAAGGRICLRDGNSKPDIEGFPGNLFISARTPTRPLVIDQNRMDVDQASGKVYSGCYVNARVNIWAMENQHGRRLNAQLAGIQLFKDGEPFSGGGAASADEFGEVEHTAQAGQEFGDLFGAAPQPATGAPAEVPQPPAPSGPLTF